MNIAKALKEWRESRGLTCEMQQAGYANNVQEELLEAESSITNLELVDAICDIAILTLNCIDNYKIEDLIYPVKDTTPYSFHEDITFILERDFHISQIKHLLSHLNHYTEGMGYDFIKCLEETIKEISSRSGEYDPDTKKWVKDTSKEAKAKWYKANYDLARL